MVNITLRAPANIFPTKMESRSIRIYIIGSKRRARNRTARRNKNAKRRALGRIAQKRRRKDGQRTDECPVNGA
jgi:hypothetical protein